MRRVVLGAAVALMAALAHAGVASAQAPLQFKLGFKALADQIPSVVGEPLEEEHYGPNGDSLQQTSSGLMVWRKADNWTAFTDGSTTWVNGPHGVQSRLNSQRFEWEEPAPPPTAPPAPARGLVLYEADWSNGMGDWPPVSGWSAVGGMLVSDGSTQGVTMVAPVDLSASPNYAVEAEIQVLDMPQYRRFGLIARSGYLAGCESWTFNNARSAVLGPVGRSLAGAKWDPGSLWHKYRLEGNGNKLTFLIDGVIVAQATDNSYLSPGHAGLYVVGVQLNVRSFKVVAL